MNAIKMAPDQTLLIIPDIHNRTDMAEEIIRTVNPDHTLFLGDYFDSYYDTIQHADSTARWLKQSIIKKDRTHLIGNHDLNYMTFNMNLKCAGYQSDKHAEIIRQKIDWDKLSLYCWIDDTWLCTHAGFSKRLCESLGGNPREAIKASSRDLDSLHDPDSRHPFLQASAYRGGSAPVAGIVWCDYAEFEDISGISQIFGHTEADVVRHQKGPHSEHYCIDTGMRHYATCRDKMLRVTRTRS